MDTSETIPKGTQKSPRIKLTIKKRKLQKKATGVRNKSRRSLVYDDSETDSDFICTEDHDNYANGYNKERHKIYFDVKGELFGTSCDICAQKLRAN